MNVKPATQTICTFVKKHAPEILMTAGISGFISAAIVTAKVSPAVKERLEYLYDTKGNPKKKEIFKTVLKGYSTPLLLIVASTACCVSSVTVSAKRSAILSTALAGAEFTLSQTKDTVKDLLGEDTLKKVTEKVTEEKVEQQKAVPPSEQKIRPPKNIGKYLAVEASTNQSFYIDDQEDIRKIQNDINEEIFQGFSGIKTLNDYYVLLGVDQTSIGDEGYWDVNSPCQLDIDSTIINGEPAFFVTPKNMAKWR